MGWGFTSHAKIAGRSDKGIAKMNHPSTIHPNARREGVFRVGKSLGQLESPAPLFKGFGIRGREGFGKVPLDFGTGDSRIPAQENAMFVVLWGFRQNMGPWRRTGGGRPVFVDGRF